MSQVEEQKVNALLAEISRLNIKNDSLLASIKTSEITYQKTLANIEAASKELSAVSEKIKLVRAEEIEITERVEKVKKELRISEDAVNAKLNTIKLEDERIKRSDEALHGIRQELEKKSAELKSYEQQTAAKLEEVEAIRVEANKILATAKQKEFENQATVKALNEKNEVLSVLGETIKRDSAAQDQMRRELKGIADSLADRECALGTKIEQSEKSFTARASELETKTTAAFSAITARESKCGERELSLKKEKEALEVARNVLNIDQLRFEKIVREKGIEEELAALRGEAPKK